MISELTMAMTKFYHDLSISELRLQNSLQGQTKLTYNDILYIDIIRAYPGKYTSTQIADMLCVSRPSVTKKIKELMRKGYVTREQSPSDKRTYYLSVVENTCINFYDEALKQKLLERLNTKYSEKDIKNLCETLAIISNIFLEETNVDKVKNRLEEI